MPFLLIPILTLTACSDTSDDPEGEEVDNEDINVSVLSATSLKASIESVTIDESLAVSFDFYLSNANGVAVVGLDELDSIPTLGAGIAKLGVEQKRVRPLNSGQEMVTAEESSDVSPQPQWVSYINNLVEPGDVADNDLETGWDEFKGAQWQAGIETDCGVECITSIGNGLYRYTFKQTLENYSAIDGIDTDYAPELIHRIYLELLPYSEASASTMLVNTTFDFDPLTGGEADSGDSRVLISQEQSCHRCHTTDLSAENSLIMHGGKRFDYEGCVMCHTSYSGDPETGASIGMATLIHKIHKSDYVIVGYNGSVHDYSSVTYPGDMHQCQQCHIEDVAPQADFYQYPGQETCLSCHEEYAPENWDGTAVGLFHDRDAFPDAWEMSCSGCHPDTNNPLGSALFHNAKVNIVENLTTEYQFALTSSVLDSEAGTLTAELTFNTLSLNPEVDPSFANLWLVAVGNENQTDLPANNGQRLVWDILTGGDNISLVRDSNKITVVISDINTANFGLTDTGTLYAKAFVCGDEETGLVTSCSSETATSVEVVADSAIALTTSVTKYTELVSEQKCVACHDNQFQERINTAHSMVVAPANGAECGSCHAPQIATDLADGSCKSCHSNNMVKFMNATVMHTPGEASIKASRTLENTLSYRELVHSLHANTRTTQDTIDGDREMMTYPEKVSNCRACHDEGQLTLTNLTNESSVVVASQDATSVGQTAEYSPTVSVCATCHSNIDQWVGHARTFGGIYQADATSGAIYQPGNESCILCHAEGQSEGVDVMHGVN
ncbi:OmcA/MtrC family decaheme c-type cytochrome [Shewanella saliphila]|nr:OmcA/MtrC family decaheme c-type cytochrome [Shewanella saliphila]MCL1101797.1 OmcA/MtrC family decaheme c-type cytochrome [Shewanella saliphila]